MREETFLHRYVKLNSGTEVPQDFALWSGFALLSCVLGRKVWLDMGVYKVYPNLYIVLVAGSGRCRKSTAIGVMENLVYNLDPKPNIIAQRISPEGLIDAVRKVSASDTIVRGTCEGFVIADELSTFLNKRTYEQGLAPLLISFYDCKDYFEYRTKGRGSEIVKNACLGILSGSTVDWIRNAIPEDAIGGGLTSRMVFVYVDRPAEPVALTSFDESKVKLQSELLSELQAVAKLEGQASLSPEAEKEFEGRYNRFYRESRFFDDAMLSGYASRRHVIMLKLSLLLSASEGKLIIEPRHIDTAEAALECIEKNVGKVMSLIVSSDKGNVSESVLSKISSRGSIQRSDLMRMMSHKINARDLTEIIETLIISGRIRVVSDGRVVSYQAL